MIHYEKCFARRNDAMSYILDTYYHLSKVAVTFFLKWSCVVQSESGCVHL